MEILNRTAFRAVTLAGRMGFPKYSLTLIVKGTFDLKPNEAAQPAEEQIFPAADVPYETGDGPPGSLRYESDFAYFKPRADLLLAGSCHAPGGKPVASCRVTFRVGATRRTLAVFGDCEWKGVLGGRTDPRPFESLPLRYENSFGGEGFAPNPIGKGFARVADAQGRSHHPLPNVQDPASLITSPNARAAPAGFGPLRREWAPRSAKLGSYGGKWLRDRWPWFPDDFDWSYFNAAPPELQVGSGLAGDEDLEFENLHRAHATYRSRLPGLRVRSFLTRSAGGPTPTERFEEIPLKLDTLWADLEAERLVLVWRGTAEVVSEDYEDVRDLLVVSESLHETAKPLDSYRATVRATRAGTLSGESADEGEGGRSGGPSEPEPSEADPEAQVAAVRAEVEAALQAAGVKPPPHVERSQEDLRLEAELLAKHGVVPSPEPWTREKVEARMGAGQTLAGLDLAELDLSGLSLRGLDLHDAVLRRAVLRGADLTGSNLKGADLSEADLEEAVLAKADLSDADLTGVRARRVNLSEACLQGAILERADLRESSLVKAAAAALWAAAADLTQARLQGADLSRANLSKCKLDQADLSGAKMAEASVEDAIGEKVVLDHADLRQLRAAGCRLAGSSLREVTGHDSVWEKADLERSDLSFALMERANFAGGKLRETNLHACDFQGGRFIKADLTSARVTSANLFQASLERAVLSGADLSGSNLYGAELLGAVVESARMRDANLKRTKLADGGRGR